MRAGYNLQLREGVLHLGRAGVGRGAARDQQEERPQSHRCPGPAAGGQ